MTGNDDGAPVGAVRLEPEGDGWVALLSGEVDAAVVRTFGVERPPGGRPALGHPPDDVDVVAVDASDVTFIDSSGLSLLLQWAARARAEGRTIELRSPSVSVLDLLRISGTASLFDPADAASPGDVGPR